MANEQVETIFIVILLLVIILFWVGLCHLLLTSYCGRKEDCEEDAETSFEYLSKDFSTKDITTQIDLPEKLESLAHIYENKLSYDQYA